MHPIHGPIQLLTELDRHLGLWAVFLVLLLENFGLPLPGEITLVFAGFHTRNPGGYRLPELFLIAGVASIAGEGVGYWLGRRAGGWMRRVFHLVPRSSALAEAFFRRFGVASVLVARFVAGLRTAIGPLAGMYGMPWRPFWMCNIVGGVVWVVSLGFAGAELGMHWRRLAHVLGRIDLALMVVTLMVAAWLFHRLAVSGVPESG